MSQEALAIGDLRDDEVEAAVGLWHAAGLTRPWNDPHMDARLALDSPASTILAGRVDGVLAATAMIGFDGHRAWVYYLGVAPDLQGRGYGRAMVAACEAWAKAHGAPKIQMMVREGNPATGFYAALGYAQDAVTVLARRFGTD